MKHKPLISIMFSFACTLSILNACTARKIPTLYFPDSNEPYKIFIVSDTHVFFANMRDNSGAYKNFEANSEGKMISYSDHIIYAFVNEVLDQKPDTVIITGDLTLNGEKLGHETLAAQLKKITNAGIRVLVIPGNHDINNPNARIIRNGKFYRTNSVSLKQFKDIYFDFGYGNSLYHDSGSLSYITQLNNYLYAVMLDTCIYSGAQSTSTGGTLNKKTLTWLEKSIKEIQAQNSEARFITAMHHNLLQHHRFFNKNFVIQSSGDSVPLFSKLGLSPIFTGHIHIQHIKTNANNNKPVTEVANSSLVVYPVNYGVAELDKNGGRYYTQPVNMTDYALQQNIKDENLFNFAAYSKAVFTQREGFITRQRNNSRYSEEDIQAAAEVMGEINSVFFAGRVDEIAKEIKQSRGYQVLQGMDRTRAYLESIFNDSAGIHNELNFVW